MGRTGCLLPRLLQLSEFNGLVLLYNTSTSAPNSHLALCACLRTVGGKPARARGGGAVGPGSFSLIFTFQEADLSSGKYLGHAQPPPSAPPVRYLHVSAGRSTARKTIKTMVHYSPIEAAKTDSPGHHIPSPIN